MRVKDIPMHHKTPCLECGACCAYYRISFYWSEAGEGEDCSVLSGLTEKFDSFRCVMKGTRGKPVRCAALSGSVGREVFCTIYEHRPSVCRLFEPSWANGATNPFCDRARIAWGLAPLQPDYWDNPHFPKAA